jgi:hypothetical protein
MIIKSKSRSNKSFTSLYKYFTREQEFELFTHNLYSNAYNKDSVVKEFMDNSKEIDKAKGKNYLYHEFLSLEDNLNITDNRKKEILLDLSSKYIDLRAKDHLVLQSIHTDTKHTHIHLMISSNKISSNKRERLSKKEFAEIQKKVETYKNSKYPFLKTEHYQDQEKNKVNQKQKLEKLLQNIFTIKTQTELDKRLKAENMEFYQRVDILPIAKARGFSYHKN